MEQIIEEIAKEVARAGIRWLDDNNTDLTNDELLDLKLAITRIVRKKMTMYYTKSVTKRPPKGDV